MIKHLYKLIIISLIACLPLKTGAEEMVDNNLEIAIFAGGCFWCMQPEYDKLEGVVSTSVGYTGGNTQNPTYNDVITGTTGHAEAIEVTFNPDIVDYKTLLDVFWVNIDPLDKNGQFCDRGNQYRTEIFYTNEEQKKLAEESKLEVGKKLNAEIATQVTKASEFYHGEEYHQEYYEKSFLRYKLYRAGCGRDARLEEVWDDNN